MAGERKKNYIKYAPEQLATVPSPAQQEDGTTGTGAARSMGKAGVAGLIIGGETFGAEGLGIGLGVGLAAAALKGTKEKK